MSIVNDNKPIDSKFKRDSTNKKFFKNEVHALTVGDLIDKLNELLPEFKNSKLIIRDDNERAILVDKIEFRTVVVSDSNLEKDDNSETYHEIKISSELGIKAY